MRNTITFIGDVFIPERLRMHGEVPRHIIGNLEAPITSNKVGWPNKINLRTEKLPFDSDLQKRVLAVCLANNHIMDYGEAGLAETLQTLEQNRIPFFGAGSSENNCNNPLFIEFAGMKIAILGYVCPSTSPVFCTTSQPGVAPSEFRKIETEIGLAKAIGAQRVVVNIHWGEEEVFQPKPPDIHAARRIIEAGADLLVGHHSHCIQPWEVWQGKYIFYGLGNAYFPDLNVPAMFDEKGNPRLNFRKRQRFWNRRSVAVAWDPIENGVSLRRLQFHAQDLVWQDRSIVPSRRQKPLTVSERIYRRSVLWSRIRGVSLEWIANPQLPRLSQFKTFWRLLTGRKQNPNVQ